MPQENNLNFEDEQIILNAIEKHNLQLNPKDYNIQALVRYARTIGFNEGYKEAKELYNPPNKNV